MLQKKTDSEQKYSNENFEFNIKPTILLIGNIGKNLFNFSKREINLIFYVEKLFTFLVACSWQ